MPYLGAHLSIAGGLPRAVARAVVSGCDVLQIFTKSVGQWRARPLDDAEVRAFREAVQQAGLHAVVAHASYLVNIASPNPALHAQSLHALGEEIDRAERLGLLGLVMHPGTAAEADGLPRIADSLTQLLTARPGGQTMILLEHTAGQGNNLGYRFEHLATILRLMPARARARVGVCLDTCHLLASGYDITSPTGYRRTFAEFDALIGLPRLKVMHLNDSKKPCASRVDRHEHIGQGCIGLPTFKRLLADPRFAEMPMLIETAKAPASDRNSAALRIDPHDEQNLQTLRSLLPQARASRTDDEPRSTPRPPSPGPRRARVRGA
jgi:deoxyribonuclease-4